MQITFETRKRNTGFCTFAAGSSTGTQRERERERERENTLLHKDEDLSTIGLFCESALDDAHSNTQYIKQEYN